MPQLVVCRVAGFDRADDFSGAMTLEMSLARARLSEHLPRLSRGSPGRILRERASADPCGRPRSGLAHSKHYGVTEELRRLGPGSRQVGLRACAKRRSARSELLGSHRSQRLENWLQTIAAPRTPPSCDGVAGLSAFCLSTRRPREGVARTEAQSQAGTLRRTARRGLPLIR